MPCEQQTSPRHHRRVARLPLPISPQTKKHTPKIQFSSSRQSTRRRPNLCTCGKCHRASPSQKPLSAYVVHCKKYFYLYAVLCASLSIFLPLCWTSPYDVFFKICNMLDRPGSPGLSCFITWNLAGLWVYAWKRNEPPWCPVLFLYEALTSTVETTPFIKISSTFSVFNIKFIQSVDD